jgi:hypothetical protein
MLDDKSNQKLDELIDRELAKLPECPAPETLIPRVMAALQAKAQKVWWQRPWFDWPMGLRVLSLTFVAALVWGSFYGGIIVWNEAPNPISFARIYGWFTTALTMGDILSTLASAVLLILNSIGKFWLFLAFAIVFLMYLSCVGIGTVCFRLALKNR